MTASATKSAYGVLTEPTTIVIQRHLPGPIERVWSYLTDSELRRSWLAAGAMPKEAGAAFELVWRHNELTDPPGKKPELYGDESRLQSVMVACDPPNSLTFTWHNGGHVTFALEQKPDGVLLTLTHRRLVERPTMLRVAAGWHSHLDLLVARMSGEVPGPHWDHWNRLVDDYDRLLP